MSTATAPKTSPPDDRRLLECPVCVSTFRNPKSLRCGHSVCFECCQQLRSATQVTCPVCRTKTPIPAEGLPTNFALQDLIEHHIDQHQDDKKQKCWTCERKIVIDDSWICNNCTTVMICANCAIKDHRGHELQMMSDIVARRRGELEEWRKRMGDIVRDVDVRRRQIETNVSRIEQRSTQLYSILRSKLEPRFRESIQELNAERDTIYKAMNEVDVSDIITNGGIDASTADDSIFQNQLNEVPQKLEALNAKQEAILADSRLALEVVVNCSEVLRQLVTNNTPKKEQEDQSATAAAASATADAMGGFQLTQFRGQRARRGGRIFPPYGFSSAPLRCSSHDVAAYIMADNPDDTWQWAPATDDATATSNPFLPAPTLTPTPARPRQRDGHAESTAEPPGIEDTILMDIDSAGGGDGFEAIRSWNSGRPALSSGRFGPLQQVAAASGFFPRPNQPTDSHAMEASSDDEPGNTGRGRGRLLIRDARDEPPLLNLGRGRMATEPTQRYMSCAGIGRGVPVAAIGHAQSLAGRQQQRTAQPHQQRRGGSGRRGNAAGTSGMGGSASGPNANVVARYEEVSNVSDDSSDEDVDRGIDFQQLSNHSNDKGNRQN